MAVVRLVRVDSYNVTPGFKDVGVAGRALPRPPLSKVRTQGEVRAVTVTARGCFSTTDQSLALCTHPPRTTMNPNTRTTKRGSISPFLAGLATNGPQEKGGFCPGSSLAVENGDS